MTDIEGAKKQQYVYLIRCGDDFFKIGIATDPQDRLKQLQTGNPETLWLVKYFSFDNARLIEETLHNTFSAFRTNGEWFKLTDDQVNRILDLCALLQGTERKSTPRYYLTLEQISELAQNHHRRQERKKWKDNLYLVPTFFVVLFIITVIVMLAGILSHA